MCFIIRYGRPLMVRRVVFTESVPEPVPVLFSAGFSNFPIEKHRGLIPTLKTGKKRRNFILIGFWCENWPISWSSFNFALRADTCQTKDCAMLDNPRDRPGNAVTFFQLGSETFFFLIFRFVLHSLAWLRPCVQHLIGFLTSHHFFERLPLTYACLRINQKERKWLI